MSLLCQPRSRCPRRPSMTSTRVAVPSKRHRRRKLRRRRTSCLTCLRSIVHCSFTAFVYGSGDATVNVGPHSSSHDLALPGAGGPSRLATAYSLLVIDWPAARCCSASLRSSIGSDPLLGSSMSRHHLNLSHQLYLSDQHSCPCLRVPSQSWDLEVRHWLHAGCLFFLMGPVVSCLSRRWRRCCNAIPATATGTANTRHAGTVASCFVLAYLCSLPSSDDSVQPGMMQPGMMQPGMMQPGMMQVLHKDRLLLLCLFGTPWLDRSV